MRRFVSCGRVSKRHWDLDTVTHWFRNFGRISSSSRALTPLQKKWESVKVAKLERANRGLGRVNAALRKENRVLRDKLSWAVTAG